METPTPHVCIEHKNNAYIKKKSKYQVSNKTWETLVWSLHSQIPGFHFKSWSLSLAPYVAPALLQVSSLPTLLHSSPTAEPQTTLPMNRPSLFLFLFLFLFLKKIWKWMMHYLTSSGSKGFTCVTNFVFTRLHHFPFWLFLTCFCDV